MEFLAQKHIYHGDLAVRNVLLTDSLVAKISKFGLSRRLYEDVQNHLAAVKEREENAQAHLKWYEMEYLYGNMKWLALEVLLHHQIVHEKSDFRSLGVLTWKIEVQFGRYPYRRGKIY